MTAARFSLRSSQTPTPSRQERIRGGKRTTTRRTGGTIAKAFATSTRIVDELRKNLTLQYVREPGISLSQVPWPLSYEGGSRPYLGALLLGHYTDEGKLIYAGRVGTGMPVRVLADLRHRLEPLARKTFAFKRPTASQDSIRIAAHSFSRALGRAEACGRNHLFDLDGRRLASPHSLRRASGDKPATDVRREASRVR